MNSSVVALSDIPAGACSVNGVGNIDLFRLFRISSQKTYLHVDFIDGHLRITEKEVGPSWACFIQVARNCHEQNIELAKSSEGLILRTIRHVKASEELLVWIGVDLISELEFPFLKPANIKGNQTYFCHHCGEIFQNPNPLKVHLFFQCKLQTSKNRELPLTEIERPLGASFPKTFLPKMEMFPNLPRSATQALIKLESEHQSLESAHHAFKNIKLDWNLSVTSTENFKAASSGGWFDSSHCSMPSPGHVCNYCGKVYSRKYGLKIHVRTHTGYKPLKCKYCFRPFSDPSNLNKHVRLHSESDTPYNCSICGKVLVRRRDLERHMKSRHPLNNNLKE